MILMYISFVGNSTYDIPNSFAATRRVGDDAQSLDVVDPDGRLLDFFGKFSHTLSWKQPQPFQFESCSRKGLGCT